MWRVALLALFYTLYISDVSAAGFGIHGGPGTSPLWIPRDNCSEVSGESKVTCRVFTAQRLAPLNPMLFKGQRVSIRNVSCSRTHRNPSLVPLCFLASEFSLAPELGFSEIFLMSKIFTCCIPFSPCSK